MGIIISLIAVFALVVAAFAVEFFGGQWIIGIAVPYAAMALFMGGFVYRIVEWARSPVPFRIPTTCGQTESLPWIKQDKLDNPSTLLGVWGRMFLEVFFFRSLFRNTKTDVIEGPKIAYGSSKWLWLAGLAFHWSFLVIFIRHFRLFMGKVPALLGVVESLDGFLQITLPTFYMTDAVILLAVTFLFLRRVFIPQVKYISYAADYFPLFLILGVATSGILMRYIAKVDITKVKELVNGIFTFNPHVPEGIGYIFFIHLFLISTLIAYFPFSKLMHMGGVLMSPTRNLANNNRRVRHINPWNPDLKFHTYAEYEDDFRKVMKSVNLPLEKDEE